MVKKAATCLNRQFIAAPVTFDCQTTGHVIGSSRDVTSTARGTTSTRARRQIGFGQVQIGSATGVREWRYCSPPTPLDNSTACSANDILFFRGPNRWTDAR
ncbi:hypothetical protein MTP99_018324 [Tenebrio molitor]|nr:hypothetical protein MTP99_018324 [Tenebrio molitor]